MGFRAARPVPMLQVRIGAVAQLAEAEDLKSSQCGFESRLRYVAEQGRARTATVSEGPGALARRGRGQAAGLRVGGLRDPLDALAIGAHLVNLARLACLVFPLLVQPLATATDSQPAARVEYEITCNTAPHALRWEVRIAVRGLDPAARPVTLELADWGGWSSIDAYYLRALHSTPPLRPLDGSSTTFALDPPADWDGMIQVSYELPMTRKDSRARGSYGLLPWYSEAAGYASGFSENTLMNVRCQGRPIAARRTITLRAPPGTPIVTGWGGQTLDSQIVTLDREIGNAQILFGRPTGSAAGHAGDVPLEIVQFGGARNVTQDLLPLLQALLDGYARTTGCPMTHPARLFLTDTGGGGTRVDWNFNAGVAGTTSVDAPEFRQLIAHELFHEWLGGMIREDRDEAYVWFKEGFTDYLALWHVAALGQVSPDWFADRLVGLDLDVRANASFGSVAFGQADVNWRDGDGPNELLAYRGGALLAFFIDRELFERGGARLPAIIGDLRRGGEGRYSLEAIRSWMESRGLSEFYARHVAAPGLPELGPALESIGFEPARSPVELAYVGLATENDELFGRVVGIDPDGPAARAGVRVGDRISGFFPSRDGGILLDDERLARLDVPAREFRYALTRIEPGVTGTYIGIVRDAPDGSGDQRLQLDLEPRTIPGGYRPTYRARGPAVEPFFRLPAR